ncbi:prohibitin family protein [Rubrivirga sp. IMCC43871]|uniref:prohibitin family protein n=1 Tax=Rubrivirga sp. IMCC43871 TaxID=3391575 RepID=UPI00398FEE4E
MSRPGILVGLGALLLMGMAGCVATVIDSGQRGVKYSRLTGTDMDAVYGEGLQLVWPWERMIEYEVRIQNADERISVLSSNGATIGMDVSVRYHPEASQLPELHTTYGPEYYQRLVQPVVRSVAREVVGQFEPEELYSTRREELQTQIETRVRTAIGNESIALQDVLIRDVELPAQVREAIEVKLREEQRAQQVSFSIDRERLEAERKRIEADGQATYQRLITESLSAQYLRYEGIQATRALAESENAKVVVIGGEDGLPLILGGQ